MRHLRTGWRENYTDNSFYETEVAPVTFSLGKAAVLNSLASQHSRRSYEYAIERFIAWYCSEPRLTFNRSVVVKYRSFLERRSLSAATINLHLSAIRRLADESAESGWLSPEHAIGIRRVKGVKRLGRKIGNWLTRHQAQELVSAASRDSLRGLRDGAMLGLLLGCGLRRSEVVGLNLDQLQSREGRWVIVNLIGKGKRLRTIPVPSWSKELLDAWLRHSGVSEGKVFRRVSKGGTRREDGVTANVVWYAVKRCACQVGIANLAPHDLRRTCARLAPIGFHHARASFFPSRRSVATIRSLVCSREMRPLAFLGKL
jgi:integrase